MKDPNPKGSVQMSTTKMQKILLMHSQNLNLHGKIFGGYIMREAFELGWLCAYYYVKGTTFPEIYQIDDIQFIASV
jgi:acyl-coenzyme A thioesterase 9